MHEAHEGLDLGILALSLGIVAVGLTLAWVVGVQRRQLLPAGLRPFGRRLYQLASHKYYVDEVYWDWIASPLMRFSTFLWRGFDVSIVDGAVDGVARLLELGSWRVRRLQTGVVFNYVLSILAGAVLLLGYLVLRR